MYMRSSSLKIILFRIGYDAATLLRVRAAYDKPRNTELPPRRPPTCHALLTAVYILECHRPSDMRADDTKSIITIMYASPRRHVSFAMKLRIKELRTKVSSSLSLQFFAHIFVIRFFRFSRQSLVRKRRSTIRYCFPCHVAVDESFLCV